MHNPNDTVKYFKHYRLPKFVSESKDIGPFCRFQVPCNMRVLFMVDHGENPVKNKETILNFKVHLQSIDAF